MFIPPDALVESNTLCIYDERAHDTHELEMVHEKNLHDLTLAHLRARTGGGLLVVEFAQS
jgi:hypothetical protein